MFNGREHQSKGEILHSGMGKKQFATTCKSGICLKDLKVMRDTQISLPCGCRVVVDMKCEI